MIYFYIQDFKKQAIHAKTKDSFLKKFLKDGEYYDCNGVLSGNHTRQAYCNIKLLIERKALNFPDGEEGFMKSCKHTVVFYILYYY